MGPHVTAGTPLDMLKEMTRLTGEVIVRALFGTPAKVGRTMYTDFTTVTGYLRTHMLTLTPGAWLPPRGGAGSRRRSPAWTASSGSTSRRAASRGRPRRSPGPAAGGATLPPARGWAPLRLAG